MFQNIKGRNIHHIINLIEKLKKYFQGSKRFPKIINKNKKNYRLVSKLKNNYSLINFRKKNDFIKFNSEKLLNIKNYSFCEHKNIIQSVSSRNKIILD